MGKGTSPKTWEYAIISQKEKVGSRQKTKVTR